MNEGEPSEAATIDEPVLIAAAKPKVVSVGPMTHLLAVGFALALLIDGGPRTCDLHRWAVKQIHPVLARIGVYQPTWRLFAPNPSNATLRIVAEVVFQNGETAAFASPEWRELGLWQSFRHCRHIKYYWRLQQKVGQDKGTNSLWDPYADYVAAQMETAAGAPVASVALTSTWREIPPPTETWIPVGMEPPDPQSEMFYSKTYP